MADRTPNPDRLAELFTQLTDDLAYARTQYPDSQTTTYLNGLAAKVHQSIYRNRPEARSRLVTFWTTELPRVLYGARRQLLYALVLFTLAVVVGATSTAHDETFARLMLGDDYINTTLANIEKNDPMAIYKDMGRVQMFVLIALNNVTVSFMVFARGLFTSVGSAYMLAREGIRLGVFQYFFYQRGLLTTSALTIWIHGTLEISAIIVAGAAGLVMGNGILFPGTYSRLESFKAAAKKGIKIVVGLVPVFLVAAFLESFVTRLTFWHWSAKLAIILASAGFVVEC